MRCALSSLAINTVAITAIVETGVFFIPWMTVTAMRRTAARFFFAHFVGSRLSYRELGLAT
jgi:hypothetical protein